MEDKNDQKIEYEEDDEAGEMADLVEKIKKIKEKLKHCQKEKQEYLTGWQRSQADFINYKRRQEEQIGEWLAMAGEKVIREILPVLDTLHSFSRVNGESNQVLEIQHLSEGMVGIQKQLADILDKNGVEEIKSVGEKFNPEFHEAMEQVESEMPEGTIVQEVQKGYLINGKVLRAAKVKLSKNIQHNIK